MKHSETRPQSTLWYPYAQMATMPPPWKVVSAKGSKLLLEDGRELIDAISSWWCVIHGYGHAALDSAVTEQLQKFAHVMMGGLTHDGAEKLATALVRITPPGLNHVFFADSGSVGMEVALKMAVQYWRNLGLPRKTKFVSLYGGYHGDTSGVMAIGDPEEGMHHLFQGYLAEQFFVHPPLGQDNPEQLQMALQELRLVLEEHADSIAAFVCEPLLQGAGGMRLVQPKFYAAARELCKQFGVLCIFDEVATGFGRTGTMFATEQLGTVPDILVLGKGLTAGYMGLSATLATDQVYEAFLDSSREKAFMHGPTFMGNALACAVALRSIDLFTEENTLQRVRQIENVLKQGFSEIQGPHVVETRVLGACAVVQTDSPKAWQGLQEFAAERGVWLRPFDNAVYTMPPYCIQDQELHSIIDVIQAWFMR